MTGIGGWNLSGRARSWPRRWWPACTLCDRRPGPAIGALLAGLPDGAKSGLPGCAPVATGPRARARGAAALPVPTRGPAVDRGLGVADRGSFLGGGRPTCQGSLPLLTAAPRETDLHDPVLWARGGPNRWRPIPGRQGTRPGSLSQCNQTPPRQRATLRPWLYHQPVAAGLGTAQSVQ